MQIVNPEISAKRRGIVLGLVWAALTSLLVILSVTRLSPFQSFTATGKTYTRLRRTAHRYQTVQYFLIDVSLTSQVVRFY